MRKLMAIALMLATAPAMANNPPVSALWGTWNVSVSNDPTYTAIMIIDRSGRVMYEDRWDPNYRRTKGLRPVEPGQTKSFGYIRALSNAEFDMVMTNRKNVESTHCILLSAELLRCDEGATTGTRVGPGPDSLMPASR